MWAVHVRHRGHALGFMPEAMSGDDIALFDVFGTVLGVPCYALLGGMQQARVRTYASALRWLEPVGLAEVAARHRDAGFTAMKLKVGQAPEIDRRKVDAGRGAVGDDLDLMADANCRCTISEAVAMARVLDGNGFVWFEEALPPEDVAGYRDLRTKVDIAIAGGECECTHHRVSDDAVGWG